MSENETQAAAEETVADVKTEAIEATETAVETVAETAEAATAEPAATAEAEATDATTTTEPAATAAEPASTEAPAGTNEAAAAADAPAEGVKEETHAEPEEISYHAVEKEGEITAIWEMQGPVHLRTIDPRSTEGQKIFALFTSEIHETDSPPMASEATS